MRVHLLKKEAEHKRRTVQYNTKPATEEKEWYVEFIIKLGYHGIFTSK